MDNISSLVFYLCVYSISALSLVNSYKIKNTRKLSKSILLIVGVLLPVIIAGIRYNVGTDFLNYCYIYKNYSTMSFQGFFINGISLYNFGTFTISKLAYNLGGEVAFFTIYALLILIITIKTLKRDYRNISFGIAIFLFLTSLYTDGFNIMKQVMATTIVFYSLKFVYNRDFIKFCISIIIAMMFHVTALIALPIYFIFEKKSKNGKLPWKLILSTAMSIVIIMNVNGILSILGNTGLFSRYKIYSEEVVFVGDNLTFIFKLSILIILMVFRGRLIKIDDKNELLLLLVLIGVCLEFTGYYSTYIKRISLYFYNLPSIVLIAQLPLLFNRKSRILIKIAIVFYAIILFILMYFILGQSNIIPYQFI